jgi:23S rRNA pseudouridine2605 synthase
MAHQFDKFINKRSGAKKKEAIRQEKRKLKTVRRKQYDEERQLSADRFRTVTPSTARASFSEGGKENETKRFGKNSSKSTFSKPYTKTAKKPANELMPLNKYVAHAGICGRREAAELVKSGSVQVNGNVVDEPGFKISGNDKVVVNGKQVHLQKNLVYILLNKPKDYITTVSDPKGRKTILDLIKTATRERVFPVGRLDRNTTGVLLITNDGDLAQQLTHPSFEIKKIYEVGLDKPLTKKDAETIVEGVTLDDGFIRADALGYADAKDKSIVGIEIHSGRNRIVRRIFEHLGYEVKKLDRVLFGNLTKNVERGKWRFLTEKEVRMLKYMNKSFAKKNKQQKDKP